MPATKRTQFAAKTNVGVDRTKAAIEKMVVEKYKGQKYANFWDAEKAEATILFTMRNINVKITMRLPKPTERRFTEHSRGMRTETAARAEWEQACRAYWRAMHLIIQAKLEGAALGIVTLESAFLADTVTASGQTVGDIIVPQLLALPSPNVRPILQITGSSAAMPPTERQGYHAQP